MCYVKEIRNYNAHRNKYQPSNISDFISGFDILPYT